MIKFLSVANHFGVKFSPIVVPLLRVGAMPLLGNT